MLEPTRTRPRYTSVTPACLVCAGPLPPASRPRRYCSDACRQRAFRTRSNSGLLAAPPALRPGLAAPGGRAAHPGPGTVYECASCGERLLERRCPECNLFTRRLGTGGMCGCGEILTIEELLAGGATD